MLGEEDITRVKMLSVFNEGEECRSQVWIQEQGAWRVMLQVRRAVSC